MASFDNLLPSPFRRLKTDTTHQADLDPRGGNDPLGPCSPFGIVWAWRERSSLQEASELAAGWVTN